MLEDSLDHAEEDFAERQMLEACTEGDMMLRVTRKVLRDRHREIGDELRDAIEAAMDSLEVAMRGDDHDQVRDRIDALNETSLPVAELLMNASIKDALEHRSVDEIVSDVRDAS